MIRAESVSRVRRILAGVILWVVALAMLALAVALFLICLMGIALLVAGLVSWLHPVDVASAWARTLGGIGLIGGSAGLAALGWLAVERFAGPLGDFARLRYRAPAEAQTTLQRTRKFVAVVGILLALICLPFAAAIHTTAHGPWLEWGHSARGAQSGHPGNRASSRVVFRLHSLQAQEKRPHDSHASIQGVVEL